MSPETVKKRLDILWGEDIEFDKEVREFDVPWPVPYDFSSLAHDIMWEEYGQIEQFWADEESS